jgi:hypothetical protein
MLPEDLEQPRKRVKPRVKPKLNLKQNKGTPQNTRDGKAAAQERMKAARRTCSLPEPPHFSPTYRGDGEMVANEYGLGRKLKRGEMTFLQGLGLNAIL